MNNKCKGNNLVAVGAYSEKGRGIENQDRFRVTASGAVVCDGIGGLEAGGLYAEMASWKIGHGLHNGFRSDSALNGAARLLARFRRDNDIRGGASASAYSLNPDGSCSISSCGDTRVYLVTGKTLQPVGKPDVDGEGRLVDYLGSPTCGKWHGVRTIPAEQMADASLLMVSDGVWKNVNEGEIGAICRDGSLTEQQKAVELVSRARQGLSTDDCTVVLYTPKGSGSHDT